MPSVLIVDDLLSIHEMLDAVIQPTGFSTAFATDGEKALARYKVERFDLVLADIDMKPMDGITLLKQLKAYDPNCVLIIMTAYASTESAIQALKFGAFDYLQKPFRVDELIATLKRGLEFRQFQQDRMSAGPAQAVKTAEIESRLIGSSAAVKKLIQQMKKLAGVRTPVLLQGEKGTGKSTVAEILHANSNPPEAPLVRIDCSLSSESDFRDGLLGANGTGGSWVQQAHNGTLFLDHIQCLPPAIQPELVSVLRNTTVGFRLLCSSNEDLEKLTDEGKFHDELFYRVASLPVHLPPLRSRVEDIPLLVKHFASKSTNPLFEASLVEFTEDALAVLNAYPWPGNLAELCQVVTKIASTTETRVVTSQQLPMRLREVRHWPKLADYLAGQRQQYVDMVLHACRGDRVKAASVLGVSESELS
ncbi:transcriptional regulatory protein ZraR [mine drainage metagenome]|uniref:Transcriptional regulatory protein ZraR n=1 Tax=mine drainage metagenome TaxID=410659 RepID=A0A1J5SEV3_9ZZZZ